MPWVPIVLCIATETLTLNDEADAKGRRIWPGARSWKLWRPFAALRASDYSGEARREPAQESAIRPGTTNRTFGQEKTHGLIVDYIGIFDDVARALDFDEKAVQQDLKVLTNLEAALPHRGGAKNE